MKIYAVDPGSERSALVEYDTWSSKPSGFWLEANESILDRLFTRRPSFSDPHGIADKEVLAIEVMKPRGMPFSEEAVQTCVWIGRFIQAWKYASLVGVPADVLEISRLKVKVTVCGRGNATDTNVRAALIDLWGGKEKAIGKKHSPGPLYGMSKDLWAALAVAVTAEFQLTDGGILRERL